MARLHAANTLGQGSSTFRVRGPIYIFHIILRAAVTADYKIIMDILNIIIRALHLRYSSFSNPPAALSTSQLILLHFSGFTYVIGTSPTSQLILQSFRRLIYVTAHSPTLPPLDLRHNSFSNPSAASRTSQAILQPFRCFTYVTGTSRTSPGEPPVYRGMKKQCVVD